jgi:hypothetical protein
MLVAGCERKNHQVECISPYLAMQSIIVIMCSKGRKKLSDMSVWHHLADGFFSFHSLPFRRLKHNSAKLNYTRRIIIKNSLNFSLETFAKRKIACSRDRRIFNSSLIHKRKQEKRRNFLDFPRFAAALIYEILIRDRRKINKHEK